MLLRLSKSTLVLRPPLKPLDLWKLKGRQFYHHHSLAITRSTDAPTRNRELLLPILAHGNGGYYYGRGGWTNAKSAAVKSFSTDSKGNSGGDDQGDNQNKKPQEEGSSDNVTDPVNNNNVPGDESENTKNKAGKRLSSPSSTGKELMSSDSSSGEDEGSSSSSSDDDEFSDHDDFDGSGNESDNSGSDLSDNDRGEYRGRRSYGGGRLSRYSSNNLTNNTNRNLGTLLSYSFPEVYPELYACPVYQKPAFPGTVRILRTPDERVSNYLLQQGRQQSQSYVGLFLAKNDEMENFTDVSQIHRVGSFAFYRPIQAEGRLVFWVHNIRRVRIVGTISNSPVPRFEVENLREEPYNKDGPVIRALCQEIIYTIKDIASINSIFAEHAQVSFMSTQRNLFEDPKSLSDFSSTLVNGTPEELQEIMESMVMEERLHKILVLLKKELVASRLQQQISREVDQKFSKRQRESFLMEQLKSIKKELGLEKGDGETLIEKFKKKAAELNMPETVKKVFDDEIAKFSQLESASSEFNITRTYLEWLTNVPWGVFSPEDIDVMKAEGVLDKDHYGLKEVKERILEFIAVGKLKGSVQGKILCLVGPPGVGKTSIGKSIAHALNREFYRFSVGGLSDVAEIKGHRRTYVGAMPGKIIQALKSIGKANPLVLIDEIDKLGRGWQGDPASALLEMLDPEQNATFLDHYLDVPVDLSKVLFVCTANVLDTIPEPLLDRMEVIRIAGYVEDEKVEIAKQYLIPQARKNTAVTEEQLVIAQSALPAISQNYCREAGVRNLQKQIEKIFRKVALQITKGEAKEQVVVDHTNLEKYLGQPVYTSEKLFDNPPAGVVTGLAWTPLGGSALYIESAVDKTNSDKGGSLMSTGQLGEVMKESCSIAYSHSKAFLYSHFPENDFFAKARIHLHVPEGAIKKDGPSAGITMTTTLLSLALNKPVDPTIAMTGEISLTGQVLKIGGVKEKVIGAKRVGVKKIIFPVGNKTQWEELEANIKEGIEPYFVSNYEQVFEIVFGSLPNYKTQEQSQPSQQ